MITDRNQLDDVTSGNVWPEGPWRIATQAGPGGSSATVVFNADTGERLATAYPTRSMAAEVADELNETEVEEDDDPQDHVQMLDDLYAADVLTKAEWLKIRRRQTD